MITCFAFFDVWRGMIIGLITVIMRGLMVERFSLIHLIFLIALSFDR